MAVILTNKSPRDSYNKVRNKEEVTDVFYDVYIDSLFLLNFVMNLYLLQFAGKLAKRTATRLRLIGIGAAGAAVFCLLVLFPGIPAFGKMFIGPLAINVVMIAFLYKIKQPDQIFWCMGYMCVYAFFLGGFMKFLFTRIPFFRERQGSLWYILGIAYIGGTFFSYLLKKYGKKKEHKLVEVTLLGGGKEVCIKALVDTGNSLIEPISKKPVSVTEAGVFEGALDMLLPEKFRLIPFHSVGKENGMLEGYEIPELVIREENEKIRWQKAVVGISKNRISVNGAYQMILHPSLLESENQEEDR